MTHLLLLPVAAAAAALIAFLCGMETAFFSMSRQKVRHLRDRGVPGAAAVLEVASDPNRYVATTLVGINLGHAVFGSIVAFLLLDLIADPRHAQIATIAVVTPFVLIACELLPKALFRQYPHGLAIRFARAFALVERLLWPVVVPALALSKAIMADVRRERRREAEVAREELEALVKEGERHGAIEDDEAELAEAALDLARTQLKEVMVPRVDVAWIDVASSWRETAARFLEEGYSRLLVVDETPDKVIGTVHFLDLVATSPEGFDLRRIAVPPVFLPETMRADDALAEIRRRRAHAAVVVDEYGGTAGLVTVEDLLEEIVGEIEDEHDEGDFRVVALAEGLWSVDAHADLDDLRERCGLDPGTTEAETLGGWITERTGSIPRAGARVEAGSFEVTVTAADEKTVRRVVLRRRPGG